MNQKMINSKQLLTFEQNIIISTVFHIFKPTFGCKRNYTIHSQYQICSIPKL